MQHAYQLAPGTIYQRETPIRNALYLRFVKRFPCVACESTRLVDPAHTGPHALGQKSSDLNAIPLCRKCHDAFDADPRDFASRCGLNVAGLIRKFNRLWESKQRRTV